MSNRVAVVGAGYWGIHHVRTFASLGVLEAVCDRDPKTRARITKQYPGVVVEHDLSAVLDRVNAVVLATPAASHAEQTIAALEAGKHVLVEKPMALSVADAERVVACADATKKVLMVGHLMVYHPVVDRLAALLRSGDLGDVYYLCSLRVNLGRIRRDENALWSLGPHDVSMMIHLLGEPPVDVQARGECYLQPGVEDVVFVNMRFADRKMAQVQLSWLDPRKERRLTIIGSKKMVEFDDTDSAEKLRIYDKGFDKPPAFSGFSEYLTLRQGDVYIPHVDMAEPLARECMHFLECIDKNLTPKTGGREGLEVVRVLEAAQASLRAKNAAA